MIWSTSRTAPYCGPYRPIYIRRMSVPDKSSEAQVSIAQAERIQGLEEQVATLQVERSAIVQVNATQTERIRVLDGLVETLQANTSALARVHADDLARIASLRRHVSQLQRQIYGPKSERHDADPAVVGDLMGKPAEQPPSPEDQATADAASATAADVTADPQRTTNGGTAASASSAPQDAPAAAASGDGPAAIGAPATAAKPQGRKPGGRMHLPEWLALNDEVIDVPESERLGDDGTPLPWIDDAISWRLDYVPPHFERVRVVRRIYGSPFSDDLRIIAPPYAAIVSNGLPTDRLVAQVVADKFGMHLPLYRQEGQLDVLGLPISRSTLVNWIAQAAVAVSPIHKAIGAAVLAQPVIGLDDTYLPVLEPGKGRCHQGRLWGYLAGEDFYCEYRATREGRWPAEFLAGYRGTLLGDAYSGHLALFVTGERTPAGCVSHARRKFDDAVKLGELRAKRAMDHFSALYEVERQVADLSADDKLAARRATSVDIMDKLKVLLEGFLATELPSSATWIAANYTLKIYPQLRQFTKDGRVPIDNNALERCWRGVGIGRRNWLFAGSARGGEWAATLISLSQCCRLVGLDFCTYLRDIFAALHAGRTDYANLRPSAWAQLKQALIV